jgi:hypothetical protein
MAKRRLRFGSRVEVLDRAGWRCWFCGEHIPTGEGTVTRFLPPARGGSAAPDNLCAACVPCCSAKHGRTVEQYRHWLWTRSCDSAAVSTTLSALIARHPDLPPFHRDALRDLAARLALAAPAIVFYGETITTGHP